MSKRVASYPAAAAWPRAPFWLWAQDQATVFRVKVDMVVLSFTVTDSKGHYINGLKPSDFRILEDGIAAEDHDLRRRQQAPRAGERRRHHAAADRRGRQATPASPASIRAPMPSSAPTCSCCSTPATTCIAASSTPPTRSPISCAAWTAPIRWPSTPSAAICRAPRRSRSDRSDAIFGLRKAVAGDDSALYNGLLLTLRDAAKVPGRKVVIVFSNGPDNASMVAPDDVRAVAEDEGIPIYVISTNEVNKDPISSNVFKRISTRTGGKAYFAKTWQKQVEAFESIREDLGNSLHRHLLSAAESERRLPQDQRRDSVGHRQEVSRARPPRIPAKNQLLNS